MSRFSWTDFRGSRIEASPDPFDNYLLATAIAGSADFLVTGDKLHLLSLRRYRGVKIITVVDFLTMLKN